MLTDVVEAVRVQGVERDGEILDAVVDGSVDAVPPDADPVGQESEIDAFVDKILGDLLDLLVGERLAAADAALHNASQAASITKEELMSLLE